MTPLSIQMPGRILFGRGEAARAPALIGAYGARGIVVHGASRHRATWLIDAMGHGVLAIGCGQEPTLADVEAALAPARAHSAQWVVALGGGAALDLGKALAALIPSPSPASEHLEVVGKGLALNADPLPFIALPTTAGTGSEATRNAVIGLPDHGRKVSLRDDRMLARLAIVDPALTDGCPGPVTLASGMDAIVQVIEPYVSSRATAFTDAVTLPTLLPAIRALRRLMGDEDPADRNTMAWTSLCGGIALANSGLGAVHGLAGVIGGLTGGAHGAICGALLGPVLIANREAAEGTVRQKLDTVCALIGEAFGCGPDDAPATFGAWAGAAGLPTLVELGLRSEDHADVVAGALEASSMKGNPVALSRETLLKILRAA